MEGRVYVHNKSEREYVVSKEVRLKIFKHWFYFIVYVQPGVNGCFVRTGKSFFKKFTYLSSGQRDKK